MIQSRQEYLQALRKGLTKATNAEEIVHEIDQHIIEQLGEEGFERLT